MASRKVLYETPISSAAAGTLYPCRPIASPLLHNIGFAHWNLQKVEQRNARESAYVAIMMRLGNLSIASLRLRRTFGKRRGKQAAIFGETSDA